MTPHEGRNERGQCIEGHKQPKNHPWRCKLKTYGSKRKGDEKRARESNRMKCPLCGGISYIENNNLSAENETVRYRRCKECGHSFKTIETIA